VHGFVSALVTSHVKLSAISLPSHRYMSQDSPDKPNELDQNEAVAAKKPAKGVYLLPNSLTTASLFSGFYAVVSGMSGDFEKAAIAIFISMILDTLDGRVARLTNTSSKFGAEYDSLADVVAFGVAPALILFSWSLQSLGNFGWVAAFIYVAGGALRLARFNVQLEIADSRYFIGLPVPAAAGVMAGMVWTGVDYGVDGESISYLVAVATAILGLLMVSNFKYYSFKDLDLKGKVPFVALLAVVLVFAIYSLQPPILLALTFLGFAVSGPVCWLFKIGR
jgi:CDP-diacylglycerol--serine O-phosphatidyltransferase